MYVRVFGGRVVMPLEQQPNGVIGQPERKGLKREMAGLGISKAANSLAFALDFHRKEG